MTYVHVVFLIQYIDNFFFRDDTQAFNLLRDRLEAFNFSFFISLYS